MNCLSLNAILLHCSSLHFLLTTLLETIIFSAANHTELTAVLSGHRHPHQTTTRINEKFGRVEVLSERRESWGYRHLLEMEQPDPGAIDDMRLRNLAFATGMPPLIPTSPRNEFVNETDADVSGDMADEQRVHRSYASYVPQDWPDLNDGQELPNNYRRLVHDLLNESYYEKIVHPRLDYTQILEVNERSQSITVNVWMVHDWYDEFLDWDPDEYDSIDKIILPYKEIWIPDTYLYNSEMMDQKHTEALMNVIIESGRRSRSRGQGAAVQLMFPAKYKLSCRMNVRFFPYDQQNCTFIISSWTRDASTIDYHPKLDSVNLKNFVPNSEWTVISFEFVRTEQWYKCCPRPWVMLYAHLVIRRKPLYYIINMVVPTSIITVVAVTGFFTPSSTASERDEKLYLGINTLLTMSIMMMMVTNQMPNTSNYVPLMSWYYMGIIFTIVIGTLFATAVLFIHSRKLYMRPLPLLIRKVIQHRIVWMILLEPPANLLELWTEYGELPETRHDTQRPIDPSILLRLPLGPNRMFASFSSQISDGSGSGASDGGGNFPLEAQRHTLRYERRLASATRQCAEHIRRLGMRARQRRETLLNAADFLSRGTFAFRRKSEMQALMRKYGPKGAGTTTSSYNSRAAKRQKLMRRCALEWEYLANCIDRCMLCLFSTITLGFFCLLAFFDWITELKHYYWN